MTAQGEQLPGATAPTTFLYQDPNNPRLLTQQVIPNPNGVANLTTTYTYNQYGQMLTTVDPNGILTTNGYTMDGHSNLLTSMVQGFPSTSYSYDANGNMIQETNPNGCMTTYRYDQSGSVTLQVTADGSPEALTTTYTYDANGNQLTETKHNSGGVDQTTTFHPDAKGRVVETDYPDGTSVLNSYDSLGHLVGTQDQNLRNKTTFYNARGEAATIKYEFDNTRQVTGFDANGRPATVTDRAGRTTITEYDDLGRAATVTYPDGSRKITQYDSQGRVTDSTDENGNTTHNTYDDAGRKLTETLGGTQTTVYTYDADGNEKTVTVEGRPYITNTLYNNLNLPTEVDYADGTHTMTEYDSVGNKTAFTDQAGKRTEYQRNCNGALAEVRQVTAGGTFKTDYSLDAVGNPVTQIDANTHATSYTVDAMNRRKTRTLPDGRKENYNSFDGVGNLTSKTDFASNSFTYGYDVNDHLNSVSGPGVSQGFIYDAAMFRVVMNDASGATTFNHDERDRLIKQISNGATLAYTNTGTGQVSSVTSSNTNGNGLTYGYDHLNRPTTIQDGVNTTLLHYDSVGNLDRITLPNGVTINQGYDQVNHLNGITVVNNTNTTLGSYTYTLGPTGNRINVQEASGRAVTWIPDDLYRLTNEDILVDSTGNTGPSAYSYDPVGNRNTRATSLIGVAPQTFTGGYNPADILKPTFNYDDNGNQLNDALGRTYTYNSLNQLTHVVGTGVDVSYVYDGDGLRVQKTNNLTSVTTTYLWDRNNLTGYPQVSEEMQNGNVVRRYVYGPEGPLYMTQLIGGFWITSYFGKDATGSVRFLMDSTGTVTDSLDYDAFGNVLRHAGSTPLVTRFQGETVDEDTGLIYLRARWYNPDLGRFMGMDTDEGDQEDPRKINKYIAFNNDGVSNSDPSGNDSIVRGNFAGIVAKVFGTTHQRLDVLDLDLSIAGIDFIIRPGHEGFRKTLYPDAANNATIGYGHKVHNGPIGSDLVSEAPFKPNGITKTAAKQYFEKDVEETVLNLQYLIDVPLYQYEFDALISLGYNVGTNLAAKKKGLAPSQLICDLNAGYYSIIPADIIKFRFANVNGVYAPLLLPRRTDEAKLFRDGTYH